MENTAKNEQNGEFFVSVDGEIQLYCQWIDKKKRQFYVKNGDWSSKFNENWEILCPITGSILRKGRKVCIHYFNIPSSDYNEKLRLAQRMLDDLNPEEKQ